MTSLAGPVLLGPDHDVHVFDSGTPALDEWLRHRAIRNQREGGSRTWVVLDDHRVVAFYASSTAVLLRANAPGRVARNQPDPLPAMLLARLAVDRDHQGEGLGLALTKHFLHKVVEVASVTGVRIALVHAKDHDAARFYEHVGFSPSPVDELTLMLLVKDIEAGMVG